MILNSKKFKSTIICSSRKTPNRINQKSINCGDLLGIVFDKHVKWDCQVANISNITSSRLHLFKRIRNSLPWSSRIRFYYSLTYPHLIYCYTLWGIAGRELLDDLKLQKKAARLLLNQSIEIPSVRRFRELNWIMVHNLIKMRKILLVFNSLRS